MTDQPVTGLDELNNPAKPDISLLTNLTELYWSLGEYSIDDRRRMKAVIHEISQIIRTWAPDPGQARICYLAINEVADRLVRECES